MPDLRFELPPPPEPLGEKLTVTIAGHRRVDDEEAEGGTRLEPFEEKFTIVDYVPFAVLSDIAASADVVDGELVYSKPAIMRFMHRVIVEAERARWFELLRDPKAFIELETVATIMLAIVGARGGVPTGPQSSSAAGSAGTNNGSAGSSSSPATTPPTSTAGE